MDLLVILLLTLVTAPVVEFTEGVPRIVLGVLFLLVSPGYTLMTALFPRKGIMQGVERAALSLVLSFALVSLSGLVLNYTPWGIKLAPIFIFISCLILAFCMIGFVRRRWLPREDRFEPRITIRMPQWGSTSKLDKTLSVGLVMAIIAATATLTYMIAEPKNEETFTDFYLLGPEGMMENYPHEVVLGEQAEVVLGIKNHENQDMAYNVLVTFDEEEAQEIGPIGLANEKEWLQKVALVPANAGTDQKVEFLLSKGKSTEPFLELHLWLDVREPQ